MSTPTFVLPFGKHKGTPIAGVPDPYLAWLADPERIETWHAPTRAAILAEVARRKTTTTPTSAPVITAEMLIEAGAQALRSRFPQEATAIALAETEARAGLLAF